MDAQKRGNVVSKNILNASRNNPRKWEDVQRDAKSQQRRGRNRKNDYQKIAPKKTIRSEKTRGEKKLAQGD